MTKFPKKLKLLGREKFVQKTPLCHAQLHGTLTPCQVSKKTNVLVSRKCPNRRKMDGKTDRPYSGSSIIWICALILCIVPFPTIFLLTSQNETSTCPSSDIAQNRTALFPCKNITKNICLNKPSIFDQKQIYKQPNLLL